MLEKNLNLNATSHHFPKKQALDEYFEFKSIIHDRLLNILDLSVLDKLDRETVSAQIRHVVENILREETFSLPLNLSEREKFFDEIIDEVLGLGPLEPFLKDHSVSDILVNSYKSIYVDNYVENVERRTNNTWTHNGSSYALQDVVIRKSFVNTKPSEIDSYWLVQGNFLQNGIPVGQVTGGVEGFSLKVWLQLPNERIVLEEYTLN